MRSASAGPLRRPRPSNKRNFLSFLALRGMVVSCRAMTNDRDLCSAVHIVAGKQPVRNERRYTMRCSPTVLAAIFVLGMFVSPTPAQTGSGPNERQLQALTAEYNQAMQAKEWPRAVAAAQQLAAVKPSSLNVRRSEEHTSELQSPLD